MMKTALGRFRAVSLIEGISYLILLFIAMPLKYFFDVPEAVRFAGMLHGVLFCLYCLTLAQVHFKNKWSIPFSIGAFIASLIPFGNFVLDRRLRNQA
jgi:integral membrane protein